VSWNAVKDVVSYKYTYKNELTQVIRKSDMAVVATYTYSPRGMRVKASSETRYMYYDGSKPIEDYDASDTLTASYVYGLWIDEVLCGTIGGIRYWYHANHAGSIGLVTDDTGGNVEKYDYEIYGDLTVYQWTAHKWQQVPESMIGNRFTYMGRERDGERGNYWFRARHLETLVGRFQQRDPLEIGRIRILGSYAFVGNNPANWWDPTGLESIVNVITGYSTDSHTNEFGEGQSADRSENPMWLSWLSGAGMEVLGHRRTPARNEPGASGQTCGGPHITGKIMVTDDLCKRCTVKLEVELVVTIDGTFSGPGFPRGGWTFGTLHGHNPLPKGNTSADTTMPTSNSLGTVSYGYFNTWVIDIQVASNEPTLVYDFKMECHTLDSKGSWSSLDYYVYVGQNILSADCKKEGTENKGAYQRSPDLHCGFSRSKSVAFYPWKLRQLRGARGQ
jgi:RHS repeat-associated protein